ncbi:MAG: PatB family C-S lyase [Porticoccaceae bacterium]|nr:PatB family C-S lyase [Pseudomonadales bacterium]MCP5171474.1 putative C-S lyase [Pseudomonadales bacterium]
MTDSPFDQIIDRRSNHAMKWVKYDESKLPMWVADADFRCPQPVLDRVQQQLDHGILGYHKPEMNTELYDAVIGWLARKHHWDIEPEWLVWVSGMVSSFHVACKAFCSPGDKVLVQTPNYPPMLGAAAMNRLKTMTVGTRLANNRWALDMDELAEKAADPKCKLFLFCNPMNPCGAVYTAEELAQIEEICLRHNVVLCSDEIHCDLILDEKARHIPAGTLPNIGEQAITLMAPSKTFNIAGLGSAFAVIRDPEIRKQFHRASLGILPWITVLGQSATVAAFTQCDDWLTEQIEYLRGNRDLLMTGINKLNGFVYTPGQATYLAWIDASGLGVNDVQQYMLDKGIAPSPGADFGNNKFTRLNFACPRSYIEQALDRLR